MNNSFTTEEEMVHAFINSPLEDIESKYSKWLRWDAVEMEGLFGIPDFLIAYGRVTSSGQKYIHTYAFEMKLRNWRRALVQAFRYSAFAHYSSVVLDQAHIRPALANLELFQRSHLGLASIDLKGQVIWHNYPEFQEPYSINLYNELHVTIETKLFLSSHWL